MNMYDVETGRQWVNRAYAKNGIGRLRSFLCTFLPPEQQQQKKIMMSRLPKKEVQRKLIDFGEEEKSCLL